MLPGFLSRQLKTTTAPSQGALQGKRQCSGGCPHACKAPGAGPLASGQNGAKTGALQFTSRQLLALHLLFIYCKCKAPRSLHLGTQSSGRGARLVPSRGVSPTTPGWSHQVGPTRADWSHTNTLSSLLFRKG